MKLNSEQLISARDWIKDCNWEDIHDDEDIDAMTDAEIEKGIARHYEGGVEQFIKDCEPRALPPINPFL